MDDFSYTTTNVLSFSDILCFYSNLFCVCLFIYFIFLASIITLIVYEEFHSEIYYLIIFQWVLIVIPLLLSSHWRICKHVKREGLCFIKMEDLFRSFIFLCRSILRQI